MGVADAPVTCSSERKKKRSETVWFSAFLNYPKEIILNKSLSKRSRAIIAFFVSMFG